ncbi:MAG: hypothetical protein JWM16_5007 [Verrucomicrobiales bacterium]|nr:hypothetical protein [Verrucomicrobiales bacterium]
MSNGRAGRKRAERVSTIPVVFRASRPRAKAAAAIRTDIGQDILDAGTAESAFEGADHRVSGIGRKRRVTVLAGGS